MTVSVGTVLRERIERAANEVVDPCSVGQGVPTGMADMGLVDDVMLTAAPRGGTQARIRLRVTSPGCMYQLYFEQQLRLRLEAIEELVDVEVTWSDRLDWEPHDMAPHTRDQLARRREALRVAASRRRGD